MNSASLRICTLGLAVLAASPLAGCPHPTRPDGGLASGIDAPADAYEEDVYVPPGTDADLDARPRDDAFTAAVDVWSADAWVPLSVDAPFPDVAFPDSSAPDARVSTDAPTPRDAPVDAGRDAWAPSAPCGTGMACATGRVCVTIDGRSGECRIPCEFRCEPDGRAYVFVMDGPSCATRVEADYVGDWSVCAESSSRLRSGFPVPSVGTCPSNFVPRTCLLRGGLGSLAYCAPSCLDATQCGSDSFAYNCDGSCVYPLFCARNPS